MTVTRGNWSSCLWMFPHDSYPPGTLGADVTVACTLPFRETAVTAALAVNLLASNMAVVDPVPQDAPQFGRLYAIN